MSVEHHHNGEDTKMKKCFCCNGDVGDAQRWHDLWYNGANRHSCSLSCRAATEELCNKNQKKTYSGMTNQ